MRGARLLLPALLLVGVAQAQTPYAYEQGDMAGAREEAKALGTSQRQGAAGLPTTIDLTATVPGYTSAPLPQQAYADNPDALVANGAASAAVSDPYRTVANPARTTVSLDRSELARATAVEKDPNAYLQGQSVGGATGSCTPLPPPTTGQGTYEATCNVGLQVEQGPQTCAVSLAHQLATTHRYQCTRLHRKGLRDEIIGSGCEPFEQSGQCTLKQTSSKLVNVSWFFRLHYETFEAECSADQAPATTGIAGWPPRAPQANPIVSQKLGTVETYQGSSPDESQCTPFTTNSNCALETEVCTSSDPVTRIIAGAPVTKPCWAWSRTYQCTLLNQATNCSSLESNASCAFQSEACLDDPQVGDCKVKERVYRCPIPGGQTAAANEYICGGDVYCINGECEPIVREASTELKDALVGLKTLGQANAEFDEQTLTLFSGARETCSSKVFGAANCCSGKGVPLITPALCSKAERQLDTKDDAGLCHKVGTWCSDEVLGVCVTKKTAYCCFESKLTRILQEQGRPQLRIGWASPKKEQCQGFTIDQFARLDLSKMDFSEVYAEFVDAVKLPDEIETAQQIQARIEQYYQARQP